MVFDLKMAKLKYGRPVFFPLSFQCDSNCFDRDLADFAQEPPEEILCHGLHHLFNLSALS